MYRVVVHSVAYAHQLDTLYRVGVKRYGFITQLDNVSSWCAKCVLCTTNRYILSRWDVNTHYAHQLDTLYRVDVKNYGLINQIDTMY